MRRIVLISLIGYLSTLAATQTVYGGRFMNLRWVWLAILGVVSGVCWLRIRSRKERGLSFDRTTTALFVYLSATLLTVVGAENSIFSGLRWASHAVMLSIFLIFVRESMTSDQVQKVLFVLKILVIGLVFLSVVKPAPRTIFDDLPVFRGAMSNANTMGQIAVIGVLLYFHSVVVGSNRRLRLLDASLACFSMAIAWKTGSRSAMIAMITGIGMMTFLYRLNIRSKFFWGVSLVFVLALLFPNLPQKAKQFIVKSENISGGVSKQITKSRTNVWSSAWEGFLERPVSGWGFGADSGVPREWTIKLTALGTVERDAVNDFLFMLEGGGIIGFGAYFLLIYIVWNQKPKRVQLLLLRQGRGNRGRVNRNGLSLYDTHTSMFVLAVSLLVLVQFDNTALSAGNFISVVLWFSVGVAGALRREARGIEFAMQRYLSPEVLSAQRKTFASSEFSG